MRKIISLFTSVVMLCMSMNIAIAESSDSPQSVTADKTAQWRYNSDDAEHDLRIHGWKEWETAAYIGFTLPEDLDASAVKKAELHLTTKSGNKSGTAYIYSADYAAFENGGQYTGTEEAPSYNTAEFGSFKTSTSAGEVTKIDVTDIIANNTDSNIAFRIDVKSQNSNNKWIIGSCTNDTQAPQLVFISDSIELNKKELTLKSDGAAETLTAEIIGDYTEADLVWSSSNPEIASVENGTVTPHKAGTADITVNINGTELSDVCRVTVTQSAQSIAVSQDTMELSVGGAKGELSVSILPSDANNKKVTWQSDNPSVAAVSSNGIVTPVSRGTANITAAAEDGGFSASCAVTVTENVPVTGITLDKARLTLPEKGAVNRIKVNTEPSNASNKNIVWSSSDTSVATVLDGVVTSQNPGTAIITAKTADGNFSVSCEVTVEAVDNLITNDAFYKDTDGNNIYSQGGGIFKFGDKYYWYGVEYKMADIYAKNPENGGEFNSENRTFIGFTCYTSTDLVNWNFEGYAMTRETEGMEDAGWVGRMGVVYNENTQKYVLVSQRYPGIMFASSDTPEGPYKYEKLLENVPYFANGSTGDQTLFQDDDGKAYLICSSASGRQYLYVAPLRESDFLDIDADNIKTIYRDTTREYLNEQGEVAVKDKGGIEGNSMFKYNGHYYFTGSDLYGWNSSRVYVLESDSILGDYNIQPIGENKNMPYIMRNVLNNYAHNSQAGFYVTVKYPDKEVVLYCGDRWSDFANNGLGYNQWVPLSFDDKGTPYFNDLSQWTFDIATGNWEVGAGNNYISNPEFDADRIVVSSPTGWEVSDNIGGAANHSLKGKSSYGEFIWEQKANTDYNAELKQTVKNLPDGEYTLKAWVKSSGGQNISELYAKTSYEKYTYSLKSAINDWTEVVISDIEIKNGECEIGLYSDTYANNWVLLDNLSLTKNAGKFEDGPIQTEKPEETAKPTEKPTETTSPSVPPIKDNYASGVLEIGDSVNFDFGASAADGYISVEPTKDYFSEADNHNLTYGFLGLGEDGYSKSGPKNDSFEMVKDQQITLYNGGMSETSDASQDNVYAHQSILSSGNTANYDMGDGTVPIRFAMKAQQHSYYQVKATVGCANTAKPAKVSIFNEKRHPVATDVNISAGDTYTVEFTANVMDVYYKNDKAVYNDDMLNIIVTGENAGLAALEITRLDPEEAPKTIWVCSDSTGCDQLSYMPFYPLQNYCGVGQYLSKYLTDMTVSNQGEGGLDSNDNMHFNMAKQQWKQGDYLYVEYGHNESALTDSDSNVTKTAVERYKDNLNKYYDAAHAAGVKLIVVGPIDRIQSRLYDKDTHTWKSSLNGFSEAGKAFVEEKIAAGADDIAFIDLNAPWIEFLNNTTENVAKLRFALGMDSEFTYSESATHYYYTYNKRGNNDNTHINDAGADNAANIFYKQVKAAVDAGMADGATASQKAQAAVLKGIADDMKADAAPYTVNEKVIKEGYAPNSLYPEKYTSRSEYPYSASIEEITTNEDGTLKSAKVRVLQDLPQYAAVYVTAYDENNNILGTATSAEHIDNTSDKLGAVKELAFNSDITPHHFKASVYYCDQNNNRLTDAEYTSAVSAQYESRKVIETLVDEDFSSLSDDTSLYGNGWNGYGSMTTRTMLKKTDTDGNSYANMISNGGNSSYTWKDLPNTVNGGKLEISFKLRCKSGSVNILTGTGRKNNTYGTTNSAISFAGTKVSFNSVDAGTVNVGEWIDYKYLIDIDNSTAELYTGAYGAAKADITLNTTEITQFMIDAPSKTSFETDIKDIKIRTVETYEFPDAESYNVTLVLNGGIVNSGNVTSYTYGTAVTLPTDVTKDNYTFGGWYDNAECTGEAVTEISATDVGDKTYYAKWTENKSTEYLDVLDEFKDKLKIEKSYQEDGSVTLTVLPIENNTLPTLKLYTAIYGHNGTLNQVSVLPCNIINGKIELTVIKPLISNSENYKLMLWTDEQAPVIAAISRDIIGFFK
ncbi:MAG: Ig-like domain-containing protein [bacterium]|nr:Ig-like domain-containing protein [bacterium]